MLRLPFLLEPTLHASHEHAAVPSPWHPSRQRPYHPRASSANDAFDDPTRQCAISAPWKSRRFVVGGFMFGQLIVPNPRADILRMLLWLIPHCCAAHNTSIIGQPAMHQLVPACLAHISQEVRSVTFLTPIQHECLLPTASSNLHSHRHLLLGVANSTNIPSRAVHDEMIRILLHFIAIVKVDILESHINCHLVTSSSMVLEVL